MVFEEDVTTNEVLFENYQMTFSEFGNFSDLAKYFSPSNLPTRMSVELDSKLEPHSQLHLR